MVSALRMYMQCIDISLGNFLDISVTVPSTDTGTWGRGMEWVSMDIPRMSQLLCHPWILGYEVEAWSGCP